MAYSGAILLDVIEVASMVAIFASGILIHRTKVTAGARGTRAGNGDCRSTLASF
jgi:hypothetical protein